MDVSDADQLAADIHAQQEGGTTDLFCNFYLPPSVAYVRRGVWWQDWFPILSLVATLPTLYLFVRSKWHGDVVIYTTGLLVAILYHYLQVKPPGGLATATFLGLPGAGWRVIDIICADLMLARSATHLLGINHPWISWLPNLGLPSFLVTLLLTSPTHAGLRMFTTSTSVCTLITIALQLLIDPRAIVHHAVTRYSLPLVVRTLIFCTLGFTCFAIPAYRPSSYWFWHSAWHICMGFAYFEVYSALCSPPVPRARPTKDYSRVLYSIRSSSRRWLDGSASAGDARALNKHTDMNGEHPLLKEEERAAHEQQQQQQQQQEGVKEDKEGMEGKGVSGGGSTQRTPGRGRGRPRKSSSGGAVGSGGGGGGDGGDGEQSTPGGKPKKGVLNRLVGLVGGRVGVEGQRVVRGVWVMVSSSEGGGGGVLSTPTPKKSSGVKAGGEEEGYDVGEAPDSIARRVHAEAACGAA